MKTRVDLSDPSGFTPPCSLDSEDVGFDLNIMKSKAVISPATIRLPIVAPTITPMDTFAAAVAVDVKPVHSELDLTEKTTALGTALSERTGRFVSI